jgi:hypothetical protein
MMKIWDQYLYLAMVRPEERFTAGTCIFGSKVLTQDIEKKAGRLTLPFTFG